MDRFSICPGQFALMSEFEFKMQNGGQAIYIFNTYIETTPEIYALDVETETISRYVFNIEMQGRILSLGGSCDYGVFALLQANNRTMLARALPDGSPPSVVADVDIGNHPTLKVFGNRVVVVDRVKGAYIFDAETLAITAHVAIRGINPVFFFAYFNGELVVYFQTTRINHIVSLDTGVVLLQVPQKRRVILEIGFISLDGTTVLDLKGVGPCVCYLSETGEIQPVRTIGIAGVIHYDESLALTSRGNGRHNFIMVYHDDFADCVDPKPVAR